MKTSRIHEDSKQSTPDFEPRPFAGGSPRALDSKPGQRMELDISSRLRFLSSPETVLEVRIRRVNNGFIKLFSANRIAIDARVEILFNGQSITAQVAYCTAKGEGYCVGISFGESGFVRRELRLPVDLPAQLTLPECSSPVPIRVLDMSPSGLGLAVPTQIAQGTGVAVDLGYGTVFGEIRYCLENTGYYRAGLALEEFIPSENGKKVSSPLLGLDNVTTEEHSSKESLTQTILAKLRLSKSKS